MQWACGKSQKAIGLQWERSCPPVAKCLTLQLQRALKGHCEEEKLELWYRDRCTLYEIYCRSTIIQGVKQLVGILQYSILYVNGRNSVCGRVFALTAPLGCWYTPLWSCPLVDPSGNWRSVLRLSLPPRLRPRCHLPFFSVYEARRKEDKRRRRVREHNGEPEERCTDFSSQALQSTFL